MNLNRRMFHGLIAAAALLGAVAVAPLSASAADKEQAALALVKSIGDEAVDILSNDALTDAQKQDHFAKFLGSSCDMERIGRFVLGQHWRTATEEQRREFLVVFRDYMVSSYADKIGNYSGENLEFREAVSLNDKETLVHSLIVRPNGPPVKLDWRVRQGDTDAKIVDIIVEGISMAQTQRSDFSSAISQPGVGVEGLINKLKAQINSASAAN